MVLDNDLIVANLMKQTQFGESAGMPVLKSIHNAIEERGGSQTLLEEVSRQLDDEARHILVYAGVLENERFNVKKAVSPQWRAFMEYARSNKSSLGSSVAAIYGVIEPFNKLALEDLILPKLDRTELRLVNEVLNDEKRHLEILEAFEDSCGSTLTEQDRSSALQTVFFFVETFKDGVDIDGVGKVHFSTSAKWEFLRDVRKTIRRIESWA